MAKAKPYPDQAYIHSIIEFNSDGSLRWSMSDLVGPRLRGRPVSVHTTEKKYKRMHLKGRPLLIHRLVWKATHGTDPDMIDHINGDRSDNRIENLRECSHTQNMRNMKPRGGKSKFKGVTMEKNNKKWRAMIKVGKKFKRLGAFKCEVEAAKAYDKAAIELFGEFALTNKSVGLY